MKKLLSFVMLILLAIAVHAQQDVTRFLGIPVDGSKSEMIRKLEAKGFRCIQSNKALVGEFNGVRVNVFVSTNNDKVCRIMVCDANTTDERNIQIRFNKLCEQFKNNSKYVSFQNDYTIPADENIGYEISVNKKRYEAVFYQRPSESHENAVKEKLRSVLSSRYTEEQLANPTEQQIEEMESMSIEYFLEDYSKRPVWFMISESYGQYYISMFYDNECNRANGEEL